MSKPGHFVISLDLELYWGMFDKVTLEQYGDHITGVRGAVPAMLDAFSRHGIHATWATVGMLMYDDHAALMAALPAPTQRPTYTDPAISSYTHIATTTIGQTEHDDPYHFGPSLVRQILATTGQEIGSHTFSHYYCIDGSKNSAAIFAADCAAMQTAAARYDITLTSIVFPRNQTDAAALRICADHGFTAYRGTESHPIYQPRDEQSKTKRWLRGLRFLDRYCNLTGHHTYRNLAINRDIATLVNVPASRQLHPYLAKLSFLEPLKLRRIKRGMTRAAKRGEVFHLWWHPHNFGVNLTANMKNLETILTHYDTLRGRYGMESLNMREAARLSLE